MSDHLALAASKNTLLDKGVRDDRTGLQQTRYFVNHFFDLLHCFLNDKIF